MSTLSSFLFFSSAFDAKTSWKVAVKKLSRPFQSIIHAKRTYRELRLLKHMKHENVSGLEALALCVCIFCLKLLSNGYILCVHITHCTDLLTRLVSPPRLTTLHCFEVCMSLKSHLDSLGLQLWVLGQMYFWGFKDRNRTTNRGGVVKLQLGFRCGSMRMLVSWSLQVASLVSSESLVFSHRHLHPVICMSSCYCWDFFFPFQALRHFSFCVSC